MRRSCRCPNRVIAGQIQRLAQDLAVANVVGQNQDQLGQQQVGLLVAEVALAGNEFLIKPIGIGDARLELERGLRDGFRLDRAFSLGPGVAPVLLAASSIPTFACPAHSASCCAALQSVCYGAR